MILTKHFQLSEFAVSSEFPELTNRVEFSQVETERVRLFAAGVLEPLRLKLNKPVIITSGKRSPELNSAVQGHPASHHLFVNDQGACDIVAPATLATLLLNMAVVRTLIIYPDFLHLSFPDSSGIYNQVIHKNH